MDVSENSGTPKSSILIRFSIINHPFWGTPIFGNAHVDFSYTAAVKIPQVLVQGLLATGMKLPEVAECCRVVAAVALLSDPELGWGA